MSDALVPAVLRAYADLCPTPNESSTLLAASADDLIILGTGDIATPSMGLATHSEAPIKAGEPFGEVRAPLTSYPVPASAAAERLARLDALHSDELLLRHGWVLVAGTITIEGVSRRILQPLMSQPVHLRRQSAAGRAFGAFVETQSSAPYLMRAMGDAEMTGRIEDPAKRARYLDNAQFGGGALQSMGVSEAFIGRLTYLTSWIHGATDAAGLRVTRILPRTEHPYEWVDRPGLVAIAAHCLYLSRQVSATSLRSTLLGWSSRAHIDDTAFRAILQTAPELDPSVEDEGDIESPMRLSPSQRAVVRRARSQPVTVVSGAPGSGKSHTVCAIALDAVARGQSVLVATQSRYAADVVTELLHRTPGPEPVRFGDGAGMGALIDELSDRQTHPLATEEVRSLESELALARTGVDLVRTSILEDLELEARAADDDRWQAVLPALITAAPSVFALDSDLELIDDLRAEVVAAEAAAAAGHAGGPIRRWRARRARARLTQMTGAPPTLDLARLEVSIQAARARRASAMLASRGGTRIGDRWGLLDDAEASRRDAVGRRLQARPFEASSLDGAARVALGQLITALRAGRGRRRELLAEMHPGELTSAAPLWIGTLSEIEDVLPAAAGVFDLVILDEASQIEQPRAAPALLRARRAVVVGDPHQLRHVSFRSDADVDQALLRHGLPQWRGLLDTRRVSAFDLAAATTPVDQLRDHFRSVPHLIEFSVRHFYRGRVDVMTRHPRNETFDAIDRVTTAPTETAVTEFDGDAAVDTESPAAASTNDPVDSASATGSVRPDEVAAVVELVHAMHSEGVRNIGVVSPFRAQADALEEALAAAFGAQEIERMSLRVGTVHAFQGGERDVVIASLALGVDDRAGRRRFLEQPNLFNVMITRARSRMIVVTSLPLDDTGLVGEYLRYGEQALAPVAGGEELTGWPAELATELHRNGVEVRTGYPVGPWRLDLCAGAGAACHDVECRVHPDGPAAHVERHLTLMGLGWSIVDAYPSAWDGDAVRAALDLRDRT